MSPAEVAEALMVSEPLARVGGRYGQENFPDGVKAFYDAGELGCVALDAVIGPQVVMAGFPLAGSDWGQGQEFLLEHAGTHDHSVLFTADGSAASDVGVLLRWQRAGEAWLTRPLFLKAEWLESDYYRDLPLEGVSD
jgi:hypothetical protein